MNKLDEPSETMRFYAQQDLDMIEHLRNYYRRNFHDGASDESFKVWLEGGLQILNVQTIKNAMGGSK